MKRKNVILLLSLVLLVFISWTVFDNYRRNKAQEKEAQLEKFHQLPLQGKTAPAFELEDLQGTKVSLSSYKGKAVLVNFMTIDCAPCKAETPWFVQLREQYGPQGFEILGVSNDYLDNDDEKKNAENKAKIVKFVANMHMNYPVLIGGDTISHKYDVDMFPTSFFIDRSGKIVDITIGLHDRDDIEADIKKALASRGA